MSGKLRYRLMTAMVALLGYATTASAAAPGAQAVNVDPQCVPGMTAVGPGGCSLAGFHWASTTVYVGHHGDSRSTWMLLPDQIHKFK
jgi:hypothetical protein